jgi:hypothetical protein
VIDDNQGLPSRDEERQPKGNARRGRNSLGIDDDTCQVQEDAWSTIARERERSRAVAEPLNGVQQKMVLVAHIKEACRGRCPFIGAV